MYLSARTKYNVSWNMSRLSFGLIFAFPDPLIVHEITSPQKKQVGGAGAVSQQNSPARALGTKSPGICRTLLFD